jgi:hypothetical protein
MVLSNSYCKECNEIYTNKFYKWCKLCYTNNLKKNFANWTSKNEKIDEFIQEMQLKIESYYDIIVEWIPYNQFKNITKISKNDSVIIYSAIWINGLLQQKERIPNKKVTLKCLYNSQNNISEFLNEVYEISKSFII